jgi:hypothetical protein
VTPASIDELVAIVRDPATYPSPVRPAGSLHSLTACAMTTGTLVHMKADAFRCIDPPADGKVRVGAGVTMFELKEFLKPYQLQIAVTPEIGNATAGSVSCCGTKDASLGTGPGQISSTVVGITLVDATGAIMDLIEPRDHDRLRLIRSSYGLFGIVVAVTFETCPLQVVEYKPEVLRVPGTSLAQALGNADGFLGFMFPYNGKLVVERRMLKPGPLDALSIIKREARNEVWKKGGRPFSLYPNGFDIAFETFFPALRFESYRVDVMIDFQPGGNAFFDFGFWAFPASKWNSVVPKYLAFCNSFKASTGFRPDLPTEVYFIKKDDRALLSFSSEEDIFTLDMVHTVHHPTWPDEKQWDDMNRQFNTFAVEEGARPLLNQTKQLTKTVVDGALGGDWITFKQERQAADPGSRFLSAYFAALL